MKPAAKSLLMYWLVPLVPATAQELFLPSTPQHPENDVFLFRQTGAVAVADFNGDGRRDLFFGSQAPGEPSQLLRGEGSWQFTTSAINPTNFRFLAVGDLDGDGDVDLAAVNTGQAVRLLINNGVGFFADQTATLFPFTYPSATCLVVGDIDGDGDGDLIVGHDAQQNRLYRNNGSGVFAEGTQGGLPYVNNLTRRLLLVDVDGDGDRDLLTANEGPFELALNNGAGSFLDVSATHIPTTGFTSPNAVAGDVDNDGDADLLIGRSSYSNVLWINNGAGVFTDQSATRLPTVWGDNQAILDIDHDGDLDLFVQQTDLYCQLLTNNGTGQFTVLAGSPVSALRPTTTSVAVADLDADGRDDLVLGTASAYWSPDPTSRDLLFQSTPSGLVERRSGLPEPWGGMIPVASLRTNSLLLLDHDSDGDLDLVVGNDFQQQSKLYDNDGNGVFTDVTTTQFPLQTGNTVEMASADFNSDGRPDLVLTNYGGAQRLHLGRLGGGFDPAPTRMPSLSLSAIAVATADLDGDGDLDLFFGADGQDRVYLNDGQGFFTDNTQNALPPRSAQTIQTFALDLDGDGDKDLLALEFLPGASSSAQAYRNDGTGIFSTMSLSGASTADTRGFQPGDFDNDGDMDIFRTVAPPGFQGFPPFSAELLLNTGSGIFQTVSLGMISRGGEASFAATDIDSDGDLDVVANTIFSCGGPYCTGLGGVEYFENQGIGASGTPTFAARTIDSTRDYGRAIAAGDVDGDGDIDVLAGNKPTVIYNAQRPGQIRLYRNATRHVTAPLEPRINRAFLVRSWAQAPGVPAPLAIALFSSAAATPPLPLPPFGVVRLDPSSILPIGQGFCSGGFWTTAFTLPNNPALVGVPFYLQSLVEGRAGGLPELRLTNLLRVTIGP